MDSFIQFLSNIDWPEDLVAGLLHYQSLVAALFLLMIEESGIPLPVPGDVVIAFLGYRVSQGVIPYYLAFSVLVVAVLLGSTILFFISRRWGNILVKRVGRFMHLDEKRLEYIEEKFKKYGPLVIIFGRHIPGFRVPITVFSGISGIKYRTFIISTFISIIPWIFFYLNLGKILGKRTVELLQVHKGYLLFVIIPVVIFLGLYLHVHWQRKNRSK